MNRHLKKEYRKWFWLLAFALFAYTIKNIFVGADVDEGYGIMVGYRLAQGDKLLMEMWEPHQTSAIFTALLIKPFLWLTGGVDFLNLYLRVIFFGIHAGVAWSVYRSILCCVPHMGRQKAALLAAFFYVSSPKSVYVPEYSNLQVWFTTALLLCLLWYYAEASSRRGRKYLLAFAGFFLACAVLAYPSMALVFPVCLGVLVWRSRNVKQGAEGGGLVREILCFTLPCGLGALLFMGYVLSYMSISQVLQTFPYILGEGSHQTDWTLKLRNWVGDLGTAAAFVAVGVLFSFLFTLIIRALLQKREKKVDFRECLYVTFFVVQLLLQTGYWLLGSDVVVNPLLIYPYITLFGIYCYIRAEEKERDGLGMLVIALSGYLAVNLLSNWGPNNLNPYLIMGVVGGFLCWNAWAKARMTLLGGKALHCLLYLMILCNVFGYSYRMIGGDTMDSTVLEVRGYNHEGLRAGILTNYMNAYAYNFNQENWQEMIPEGSVLFYVGNSSFLSMAGDCAIASPNTISTPSYDEALLTYWRWNPSRYPNVVAVEGMYGELAESEDSFVMQWLEKEFQPTEVIEYPYMTVYKRE